MKRRRYSRSQWQSVAWGTRSIQSEYSPIKEVPGTFSPSRLFTHRRYRGEEDVFFPSNIEPFCSFVGSPFSNTTLARVQERWQVARSLATPATWADENHSRSCQRFQKS